MNGVIGQTRIDPIDNLEVGLQISVFMADGVVLGDETFRLISFQGQESIGELFEYTLELHANTDPQQGNAFDFRAILGRPVTVGIKLAKEMVYFNGIVASFAMDQPGVYRITMRPALWKLGLVNDYRHFSGKNIREAVTEVLNRYDIKHVFKDEVDHSSDLSITRTQDWLQAGESDLEFIRRLFGKAHLFYFFEHSKNGHCMVITGGVNAYSHVYPDDRPLRYTWTGTDDLAMQQDDVLLNYSYQESLTSSHVEGTYVRQQAVWDVDGVAKYTPYSPNGNAGDLPFNQYKVFQYGLSEQEATHLTKKAEDALNASRSQLNGSSGCPHFGSGKLFRISGKKMAGSHPMPVRPSLEDQQYVLTMVKHEAKLDGHYHNEFQAVPKAPFIHFTLQDTQQGSILAKVVKGEPDDWRYFPRSVFEPDTDKAIDTQADPSISHAKGVRVELATGATFWARLSSAMQSAPEIGAMVLISRANDESELPEVTNTLSSDGSMTVTPSGWTSHSSVGNSYSTSWGDSKSIRCGAVTPDVLAEARTIVEKAYSDGQYKDSSYSQGGGFSYSTSEKGRSGMLSRSESYGNTYSHQEADKTENVSDVINSSNTSTITGTTTNKSTVNISVSNSDTAVSTNTGTTGVSTNTNTTGLSTNISTTGIQNDSSAMGMQSSVSMIGMQNSASLVGMSKSDSATGLSTSTSLAGIQNSVAAVGLQNSVNLTGSSTSAQLTGVSTSAQLTGVSTSAGVTGISTGANLTGVSTTANISGISTTANITGVSNETVICGVNNKLSVTGPVINIDLAGAVIINIDPAALKIHIPGIEINIDVGLELHL